MTKVEFLKELEEALRYRSLKNVSDILLDYEEHFAHAKQKGIDEGEVCKKLGSPNSIAKAHQTESMIDQIKNPDSQFQWGTAIRTLGRLMVITPVNLIIFFFPAILLGIFFFLGWAMAISVLAIGVWGLFQVIKTQFIDFSFWTFAFGISSSLGVVGMAVFSMSIMALASKYTMLAIINYLQWNLKIITGK